MVVDDLLTGNIFQSYPSHAPFLIQIKTSAPTLILVPLLCIWFIVCKMVLVMYIAAIMRNWCKTTINKSIIFTWLSTLVNRIYDFEGCLSDCTKNFYSFNAVAVLIGVLKRYAWFIKYFPSWINTKQRWYVFSLIKKNRFAQITDTFVHQMFETQETVTMHVNNTHVFNQA